MLLPNRMPNRNRPTPERRPATAEDKKRFWVIIGMSLALLLIYYGFPVLNPELTIPVMIVYMIAFTALLVSYLAYNRCFVNKDVTVDMLPPDWSEEKKQEFVDANKRRAEKSRWMLVLILPFVVVFMAEALYLFVWDGWLSNLLGMNA